MRGDSFVIPASENLHNNGKDQACIGDKRAIMCADCAYALPDDHEPRNIATDKHAQSVR